jgi:hypothetical protein
MADAGTAPVSALFARLRLVRAVKLAKSSGIVPTKFLDAKFIAVTTPFVQVKPAQDVQ